MEIWTEFQRDGDGRVCWYIGLMMKPRRSPRRLLADVKIRVSLIYQILVLFFGQGNVDPQANLSQPFGAPQRVGRLQYDLGDGRLALLVPYKGMGQGEYLGGYQIFIFDGKASTWAPGGDIKTFDGDKADCDDFGKPLMGRLGCFAWTGSVRLMPSSNDGWPQLAVHATGTAANSTYSKLIPAPDIIYSFDRQRFIQVSPPPVQ
jgi:hypothetical protein